VYQYLPREREMLATDSESASHSGNVLEVHQLLSTVNEQASLSDSS
jgi:hypothetical protein